MEYSHPPDLGQVEHRMAPHGTDTRQRTREGPVQSEPSSALDRQLNGERNCPVTAVAMSIKARINSAWRHTPQADGTVGRRRSHHCPVRRENDVEHAVGMSVQTP